MKTLSTSKPFDTTTILTDRLDDGTLLVTIITRKFEDTDHAIETGFTVSQLSGSEVVALRDMLVGI